MTFFYKAILVKRYIERILAQLGAVGLEQEAHALFGHCATAIRSQRFVFHFIPLQTLPAIFSWKEPIVN